MAATIAEAAAADRVAHRGVRARRPLRARQARADRRARPRSSSHGQVTNDIEALDARARLLRRLPDPQGQDARPTCACSTPATSCWLDTERVALQALFDMIRRCAVGYAGRAAQAHAAAGAAVARRARTRARRWAARLGPPSTPTARARARRRRRAARRHRPRASTSSAPPSDADARARRALGVARACPRPRPRSLRVERGRPRYGVDLDDARHPPGGRPQRARGVASPRAATSARRRSRACTTAASPTATCAGCASPTPVATGDAAACSASARSGAVGSSVVSPAPRSDRAGAGAARGGGGRRARRGRRRARSSLSCRSRRSRPRCVCAAAQRLRHHRGEGSRRWRPSLARSRSSRGRGGSLSALWRTNSPFVVGRGALALGTRGTLVAFVGAVAAQTRHASARDGRGAARAAIAATLLPSMRQ